VPGIFLSYSRETTSSVKGLAGDIEGLGYSAWLDQDLNGGKSWWDEILSQIRGCDVFVMTLSPDSLRSTACNRECGYAEALGKPILPIMVADGVSANLLPPRLSQIHYVDYRKQDRDAITGLARALRAIPPAAALPQPLPEPPSAPISYLGRIAERLGSDAALDSKDQAEIVSELRSGLEDAETADDARTLLKRFSERPDLLARTSREIETLLHESDPPHDVPTTSIPPALEVAESAPTPSVGPHTFAKSAVDGGQMQARVGAGILGAIAGAAAGWVALELTHRGMFEVMLPAMAGAVAGAIGQYSIRVAALAVLGAVLGLGISFAVYPDVMQAAVATAAGVFVPIGVIAGAGLGAILRKMGRWS